MLTTWGRYDGQNLAGSSLDLNLAFPTGGTLDKRVTFSRTSNATLTGSNGLIQYAPHNLLTYSEQFDNSTWGKLASSITSNTTAITAPNSTNTADVWTIDATSAQHYIQQAFTYLVGNTYVLSVYIKKNTQRYFQIGLSNSAFGSNAWANFDVQSGILGTVGSAATAAITDAGNGWYRCSVSGLCTTGTAANSYFAFIQAADSARIPTYSGDGTSSLYMWGAQLNVGALQPYYTTAVKNLLGYTQEFDNAAWTKSNSFIQTNLLTYSEQFDNAAWTKSNATISANAVIAPDGNTTADKLVEDSATNTHLVQESPSFTTGVTYTQSVYAKAGERTFIQLRTTSSSTFSASFDLSAGTYSQVTASTTAAMTSVGNGWYRCSITFTAGATGASACRTALMLDATTQSYAGNGSSGAYIWGAQLVQGAIAGDYVATTSAAKPVVYAAPDGSTTGEKLVENSATNTHYTLVSYTTTATTYTYSFYAKAAERTFARSVVSDGTNFYTAYYNLSTGAVGTVSGTGTVATITSVGNGWYRCALTATTAAGSGSVSIRVASANGSDNYAGDGTSGIYIWGAQLSDSASLDTYVYNPVAAPSAAAYYGPRFDYDPVTLQPKGLLIEEARTNSFTYSEQFDNAAWTKSASSISADAAVSPDGNTTADKLVEDTTSAAHLTSRSFTTTAADYSFSVYAKAAGRSRIVLAASTDNRGVGFDLSTGQTFVQNYATNQGTGTITALGNGWYRCNMTWTATAVSNSMRIVLNNGSGQTYTGDGVSGVYIWGAQLEAGAFATSYIPTASATATRAADSATMIGANFSNWYNQSEGTFYSEYTLNQKNFSLGIIRVHDGSANNTINMRYAAGSQAQYSVLVGGVGQVSLSPSGYSSSGTYKRDIAYKVDSFQQGINGALPTAEDTSGSLPTVSAMDIGAESSSNQINGWIKRIAYYPRRLANSELQALTS